ncbi:MAG: PKD domain-containing protein [Myxococcales bacterium]
MRIRLTCAAALVCVACVKRVAPSAVEDRTVVSGVPTSFGSPADLPEGVNITWDFGDGTPQVSGLAATHAFPRAGAFTLTETVDQGGEKQSVTAKVTVLRRAVASAVPGDARAALIQEMPWHRMALHRETATRLGMRDVFDDTARTLSDALGFDATSEQAAADNGFDPDEGLALYTVPDDAEALVATVGTSDDAKALAALKRLLAHAGGTGRFSGGPFQLTESALDGAPVLLGTGRGGEKVGALQRLGYLYVRLPGMTDPTPALRGALKVQPNGGLFADGTFQSAIRHVGSGDMVFFSRGTGDSQGRLAATFGPSAFTVIDRKDLLEMRIFAQPRDLTGEKLQKTFTPLKPPPDLAAKLPRGPAAYLKLSGEPAAMWRELLRMSSADADRTKERVKDLTGLDLEKDLLPSFTGNVGVGVYLDSFALLDALLGEQVASLDRSGILAVAELQPGKAQPLASAIDSRVRPERRVRIASGATVWKLGDNGAEAAIQGDFLYLSLGGEQSPQGPPAPKEKAPPPPRRGKGGKQKPPPPAPEPQQDLGRLGALLAKSGGHTLGDDLKADGVRGFDIATDQIAWLDVRGLVRSIQAAAQEHGGVLGAGTRLVAERFGSVRDVLLEARPAPDGVQAQLYVRFGGGGRSGGRGSSQGH